MNNIITNNTAPTAAPMAVSGNALVSPAEVVGVTLAVDEGAVMLCVIDVVPVDNDDLCVIDAVPVDDDLCVLPVIVYVVDVVDNLLLVPEDDGLTIAIKGIMNIVIMIIFTSSDCHTTYMNNIIVTIKVSMTLYTMSCAYLCKKG